MRGPAFSPLLPLDAPPAREKPKLKYRGRSGGAALIRNQSGANLEYKLLRSLAEDILEVTAALFEDVDMFMSFGKAEARWAGEI